MASFALQSILLNYLASAGMRMPADVRPELAELQDLVRSCDQQATTYLATQPDLAAELASTVAMEPLPRGHEALSFTRMQRYVSKQSGFFLPRLLFPEQAIPSDERLAYLSECDDSHIAQLALLYGAQESLQIPGISALKTGDFDWGGELHSSLMDAIQREVIDWPEIFSIKGLDEAFPRLRASGSDDSVTLSRLAQLHYHEEVSHGGYGTTRKPTEISDVTHMIRGVREYHGHYQADQDDIPWTNFFSLGKTNEGLLVNHGINNIERGCVAAIEHTAPLSLFLTFLTAAYGNAYVRTDELGLTNMGNRLFNIMLQHPSTSTSIRFYLYSDSEEARLSVDRFLKAGIQVYFDLGQSISLMDFTNPDLKDDLVYAHRRLFASSSKRPHESESRDEFELAWEIINSTQDLPLNDVGTDEINEPSFQFLLLSFSTDQALQLFECMVDENPEMAARAAEFYASMPGYSLPVLRKWRDLWQGTSEELQAFLNTTISRAETIAEAYLGKTVLPPKQEA